MDLLQNVTILILAVAVILTIRAVRINARALAQFIQRPR